MAGVVSVIWRAGARTFATCAVLAAHSLASATPARTAAGEAVRACQPALAARALAAIAGPESGPEGPARAVACAQFRALPAFVLLAVASHRPAPGNGERPLRIWALQEGSLATAAASQVSVQEDAAVAVAEHGLRFATAPLALSPNTWGLSLDFTNAYQPNCGSGTIGTVRTIFAFDGHAMRPVLEDLVVASSDDSEGALACESPPTPAALARKARVERTTRAVVIGSNDSSGLRDLSITTRVYGRSAPTSRSEPWRFDGQRYRRPSTPSR